MRLTLCLPGLLLPRQALRDCVHDLALPALSLLLGRGRVVLRAPLARDDWIATHHGLAELPIAPLRLRGEGGDPGTARWLCLDPVHLAVGRGGVTLADPTRLQLDADEDAALRAALAPLCAAFGTLTAQRPGHWHVDMRAGLDIATLPLPAAIGNGVAPGWPAGADGPAWRRALAEAQMLLHAHPVNAAREARGAAVINSLWPWGAGSQPAPPARSGGAIWGNDAVLRGLAHALGGAWREIPARFATASGDILAVLDDLVAPAHALDGLAWRESLLRLERDWFAPLVAALRQGQCRDLRLVAFGPASRLELHAGRALAWTFWRQPRALHTFFPPESA